MRNQIEAIVQTLSGSPTFAYGTQNELNTLADDIANFPCVFMYPLQPIEVSPQVNGSVDNTFTLYLEFLYKTDFGSSLPITKLMYSRLCNWQTSLL